MDNYVECHACKRLTRKSILEDLCKEPSPGCALMRYPQTPWPWHIVTGNDLLDLLRRAHQGEDPDELYIEAYGNDKKGEKNGGRRAT